MPSRSNRSAQIPRGCRMQVSNQVVLERVLGFTSANNCALSLDQASGAIAYAAGCVIVLRTLDPDRQRFIQSASKKAITAVDFSPDGKFIATGESGHHPMVRLWNVSDGSHLAEFAGHHFRVIAVRFSPSARYLVSLGSQDDNTVYVWDRTGGQRVASAKVTNKINGVAFSPNGQFFVTVGVRHVRFWYLEIKRTRNKETIPLNGRNAILGDLLHNAFMDVCCVSRSSCSAHRSDAASLGCPEGGEILTLVVSKAGHLMQFSDQRYLDKWVELRTSRASCLSVHRSWVTVGCANGTCLLFDTESLQFLAQLPLPHQLGSEAHLSFYPVTPAPVSSEQTDSSMYPDLLAIKLDCTRSRVTCFYADHSVYVWDVTDLSDVQRAAAYFYHSRGVWSVDCLSESCQRTGKERIPQFNSKLVGPSYPPTWWSDSTFVTCADDGTIRFWNVTEELGQNDSDMTTSLIGEADLVKSGVPRAKEQLMRIIFADPTHKLLCVSDRPTAELTFAKFEAGVGPIGGPSPSSSFGGQLDSAAPSPSSPTAPSLSEASLVNRSNCTLTPSGCCVRAVCISPDCRHLAAGDRDGILRIYSLANLEQQCQITAHDSEILSLNFFRSDSVPELTLLCSASRDRLIHIFDPNQEYSLVQTVADHSAAIFAARIIETEYDGEIRLISCGMDKSLLIRVLEPDEAGLTAHFALEHHLVGRCSQLDAAFTPTVTTYTSDNKPGKRKRYLAVACQDRRLRIYNIATGRQIRCYRGSFNEDGCLVRCAIDPTGSVVATSGSDKQLNLFYLLSGESIAPLFGHSELALGLRFLPDLRHFVTVSADSCVFIWRLATDLTQHLSERSAVTRRTSSCSGLSTTSTVPSGLRSTASFRLPRPRRTKEERSGGEDSISLSFNPSWGDSPTEYDQTDEPDEDSEVDLLKLDTDELLPRDSCLLARIGRPADVPDSSDYDDRISSVSYDSCQTAKSTLSDQKDTTPNKPAFYFSVSALPAWARRKLSRRDSVALVPPSLEQLSLAAHPERLVSRTDVHMERSPISTENHSTQPDEQPKPFFGANSGVPMKQTAFEVVEGSGSPRSRYLRATNQSADSNTRPDFRVTHPPGHSAVQTRVVDSRTSRSNASRDASPKSNTISAPTTPYRRHRLSAEAIGRRSMQLPKNHVSSVSTPNVRSIAVRSESTRAIRAFSPPSNSSTFTVEECDEASMFSGYSRRASACRGGLERAHTSSSLRRPAIVRPTPHSKSTVELRSNSGSARGSLLNISMTGSDRPSESCVTLPTTESDQSSLFGGQTSSVPISVSSNQISFGTLEGISERASPNHTNNSSFFGDSRSATPLACSSTRINGTESKTPPVKSPVDSLNEAETGSRRPAYTAPTIASRRKVYPPNTQDHPTTVNMRPRNTESSTCVTKKASSALSVEVNSCSNQSSERQSGGKNAVRLGSPFPHTSDAMPICSASHICLSQSEAPSPQSPQLSRARWAPASCSPRKQQAMSQRTDPLIGKSTNTPRPNRPKDLFAPSTGRVLEKQTTLNTSVSQVVNCDPGDHAPNSVSSPMEKPSVHCRTRTLPGSRRDCTELGQFHSTCDAFRHVQEALDAALKHCANFRRMNSDQVEELQALRSLITEELEWRFTQLRAMLGLEPVCVDPPVARVLLADLVERLIPELRTSVQSDNVDAIEDSSADFKDVKPQPEGSYEWIVDSTTGASPMNPRRAAESHSVFSDHVKFELSLEGEEEQS
ncbi:hypothetical protein CRM22_001704 [Opisthorchis felineus]|uniref:MABP1/WDR62 second WD40 domain-containing protein n=1 Tax=Opisthorchis felineus TaxID=147828 RepID=A0A4S2M9D0_OPIFE|nr:hypothetical protein CRM22_001704 [Opisthorchis felineus]